jgi:hypothetical protein
MQRVHGFWRDASGSYSATMTETKDKVGSLLRFLASSGMADEDPDIVRELLTKAHDLATAILSDPAVSPTLRADANAFLEELRLDTYGHYGNDTSHQGRENDGQR